MSPRSIAASPAVKDVSFTLHRGEVHALARREWRWQVDADQDDRWRRPAHGGRDLDRRGEDRARLAVTGAQPRHRDGLSGDQLGAVADGRAEHLPDGREALPPAARHLHRRPAVPAVAQLPCRSDRDGVQPRRRPEADGGDRPGGPPQRTRDRLRRADGDADAGGEASVLFARRAPEGARRVDHLHLATRSRRHSQSPTGSR